MSRVVGEYVVTGKIGQGSFAVVYKGHHKITNVEVAIKAINRERLNKKLQENLESEISILKNFQHPNIVKLYDIKKTERHIYLVLEYCGGGDLQKFIKRNGPLSEETARGFLRQLADGLEFLWSKNLIHRDLKPQNLLLTEKTTSAVLKIADFGFARHLAAASMAETLCGSPLYMAPEILKFQKYDAKADLWSVGAILYEMVVGKPPFGGANHVQLLANIERNELRVPTEIVLSAECLDVLQCLLRRNPMLRVSFEVFFNHSFLKRNAKVKANDWSLHSMAPIPEARESQSDLRQSLSVRTRSEREIETPMASSSLRSSATTVKAGQAPISPVRRPSVDGSPNISTLDDSSRRLSVHSYAAALPILGQPSSNAPHTMQEQKALSPWAGESSPISIPSYTHTPLRTNPFKSEAANPFITTDAQIISDLLSRSGVPGSTPTPYSPLTSTPPRHHPLPPLPPPTTPSSNYSSFRGPQTQRQMQLSTSKTESENGDADFVMVDRDYSLLVSDPREKRTSSAQRPVVPKYMEEREYGIPETSGRTAKKIENVPERHSSPSPSNQIEALSLQAQIIGKLGDEVLLSLHILCDPQALALDHANDSPLENRGSELLIIGPASHQSPSAKEGATGLSEALSLFLKAMSVLREAIAIARGSSNPSRSDYNSTGLSGSALSSLSGQFSFLFSRAELCSRGLGEQSSASASIISAEEIIYRHSMSVAKEAALKEYLGSPALAFELYTKSKLLLDVLSSDSKVVASDKKIVEEYRHFISERLIRVNNAKIKAT